MEKTAACIVLILTTPTGKLHLATYNKIRKHKFYKYMDTGDSLRENT